MKNKYEWKDVTGECEIVEFLGLEDSGSGAWGLRLIHHGITMHFGFDGKNTCFTDDYRLIDMSGAPRCFRIERRVEVKPFVFTYTPEFVTSLDCKNMSAESVLHHCVLKWDEVIAAHEAGVNGVKADDTTCPACAKYFHSPSCGDCPLGNIMNCCGGNYGKYGNIDDSGRTTANAIAVRDYIQGKLDEIRKPQAWVPKVGDRVMDDDHDKGIVVAITRTGKYGIEYDDSELDILAQEAHQLTLIEAAK